MKEKIENLLNELLPEGAWRQVTEWKGWYKDSRFLAIKFAASDYLINNVRGQRPQAVSLNLDLNTMVLEPQVFGGNGGQHIVREPNMDDSREKYLAMKGVKIPFRKPKPTEDAVLRAVERFVNRWKDTLAENIDVLMYRDKVDYKELLNI